jgi:hypothetical protein
MDNSIFQNIAESITNKQLQRTALSLAKGYKPTVAAKLETAMHFTIDLYFDGSENEALQVCELMAQIQYNGNYNIWTWVEATLLLKSWIHKKSNSIEKLNETIKRVDETSEIKTNNELADTIKKRVKLRNLAGNLICYKEIEEAMSNGDKATEMAYRKIQYTRLLYIYFLGGSTEFSTERAFAEIENNEQIIKNL